MQKILKKLAFYFLVYSIGLIAMNGLSAVRQMHTPRPASAPLFNLEMKRIENTAKSGTHGTAKRLQGRTAIVSVFASVLWGIIVDMENGIPEQPCRPF